jgi:hypothetical protein
MYGQVPAQQISVPHPIHAAENRKRTPVAAEREENTEQANDGTIFRRSHSLFFLFDFLRSSAV